MAIRELGVCIGEKAAGTGHEFDRGDIALGVGT
jgi:hypothetical protein